MSDVTKRYNKLRYVFFWLGILMTFLPLLVVGTIGCMNGTIQMTNKLRLGVCFATAIILTVLGVKSKYNCRSITYILVFGSTNVNVPTPLILSFTYNPVLYSPFSLYSGIVSVCSLSPLI